MLVHSPSLANTPTALLDPDITQRWLDRRLSNFDYLMLLNQASGRSNNDLSQYHVFPWVLRDYSASSVDLQDPLTCVRVCVRLHTYMRVWCIALL